MENPSRENVIDTIEKLKAMPNIEYAEPNYNVYEFSEPNDTYYQNGKQAVLDLIGAKKLWDFDIDCSDVTVGVMDSGIQTNHEDLIDNIWVNTGEIVGDRALIMTVTAILMTYMVGIAVTVTVMCHMWTNTVFTLRGL